MNSTSDLTGVLAEWHRLTKLEAQAILNDDWPEVAAQQQRKEQLQEAITCARKPVGAATDDKLKALVTELIALETRNRDAITAKQQSRQAESECVNEAVRNLRSVRRTYGEVHSPRWHSYS